jgi:hypothetical protein
LQAALINRTFTDTTAANLTHIDAYAGAMIFTTSDNKFWLRNSTATQWIEMASSTSLTNIFGCNNLFVGGEVSWRGTGLVFDVNAATYSINCRVYSSPVDSVTLANGDPSNPRIDVIAVDTNGQVVVLQGTPAASPLKPQVDPASQLELSFVTVNTGATVPSGITLETIYDEALGMTTEWDTLQQSWTSTNPANFNNTLNTFHLTKAISISNSGTANTNSFIRFTASDTMRVSQNWQVLKFWLRLNANLNANQGFSFQWTFNGSPRSNIVNVLPGNFTFSATATNTYQPVVLTMGLFQFTDSLFNQLYIKPINGTKNFYMDWIQLQAGLDSSLTGNFIINQFQAPQLANFWISGSGRADRWFTSPGTNGSEKFGWQSAAANTGNAFGQNANATFGVAMGFQATVTSGIAIGNYVTAGSGTVAIGSTSPSSGNTSMGMGVTSTGANQTIVGASNYSNVNNTTTFGRASSSEGQYDITIGHLDSNRFANSIIIGNQLISTATRQLLIGDGDQNNQLGITQAYLGSGVINPQAEDLTLQITGESGTNISGHALNIAAGKGTGNASTGSIINLQTSDATVGGTTLQSLSTKLSIAQSGQATWNKYISGNFSGTAAYGLGVTSTGAMIVIPSTTSTSTVTVINDSTIVICNGISNICDTVIFNDVDAQNVFVINDSTLLVCNVTNTVCDTVNIPQTFFDRGFFDPNQASLKATDHDANSNDFVLRRVDSLILKANAFFTDPTGIPFSQAATLSHLAFDTTTSRWYRTLGSVIPTLQQVFDKENARAELNKNDTISVSGNKLHIVGTSSAFSITGAGNTATITSTGSIGLFITGSSTQSGLNSFSNGVRGAVFARSTSSFPITAAVENHATANNVNTYLNVEATASGTVLDGFGTKLSLNLEENLSQLRTANEIVSKWTNASGNDATSQLIITGMTDSLNHDVLYLAGGQSTLLSRDAGTSQTSERYSVVGTYKTLTESSATSFVRVNIPTGTVTGGEIVITVEANDATDFQARTLRFIWSAVNKSGTITANVATPEESDAVSTGTLTVTIDTNDAGSGNLDFRANATSSLTQTVLRCSYQVFKNIGTGTITPQ